MPRGPYPILLMLAMSLPGAARALGLGDIRVDSALNEPLSAQIDIVGATRDDLMALTAKVASQEVFQRYRAERPSFLSTATFKVGIDAQGRPVLNIRSGEAFTDPVINFLVELRWNNGELIRDYSLLLDPAGFSPESRALAAQHTPAPVAATLVPAQAANAADTPTIVAPVAANAAVDPPMAAVPAIAPPVAATPTVAPSTATPPATATPDTRAQTHRVAARDTLRGITRRAGARSETHARRMMIAIFRANPHAFEGNINRLHDGALLSIPSADDVQAVGAADAKHEYSAQMAAWRLDGRPGAAHRGAANPAADALTGRVQFLERTLDDMHRQLDQLNTRAAALVAATTAPSAPPRPVEVVHAAVQPLPIVAATVPAPYPSAMRVEVMRAPTQPAPIVAAAAPAQAMSGKFILGSMAVSLALILAGFTLVRRRLLHSGSRSTEAPAVEDQGEASNIPLDESTPAAPRAAVRVDPVTVFRAVQTPKQIARESTAPAAHEILELASSDVTTQSLAIDVKALEESYPDMGVDSLGIDSVVDETAAHDTATLDTASQETVNLDRSEIDTAIIETDAHADINAATHAQAVSNTVLDYNLLDLDATVQHVQMPSQLNARVEARERRTNIVDVLKAAIDRDPGRSDLRMKLLETYYSSAATNQRAFMDVVRKAWREHRFSSTGDWQKVVMMGREIASADIMFADQTKDDKLANCA